MLMVASRMQQKVRVLPKLVLPPAASCPHEEQSRATAEARPLARISTGQLAVLLVPHAYYSELALPLGDSDEQLRKLSQTQPTVPSTFPRHRADRPSLVTTVPSCASGPLLSIIAKLFLRRHFREKLTARRNEPIHSFKMSLQEKLDKIRSPKLQNQHQVVSQF